MPDSKNYVLTFAGQTIPHCADGIDGGNAHVLPIQDSVAREWKPEESLNG